MFSEFVLTPSGPTMPANFISVCTILPALCIVFVLLRFNVRRLQKASLRVDDWLILPALFLVIGMAICGLIGETHGVWAHITPPDVTDGTNSDIKTDGTMFEGILLEVFQYIQILALALIKLSALSFYHRVFDTKTHRTVLDMIRLATIVVVGLWTVAMIIMNSLQCGSHIAALWVGYDVWSVYCSVMSPAFEEAFAISNFLLDLWILLLPLPNIARLHATRGRRFGIAGVFLLASIGLGASIARMVDYIQTSENSVSPEADYRLMDTLAVYWSILEAGVCLLAVNLPSLWFYSSKLSPERMLASIRSAISLGSIHSDRSQRSRTGATQLDGSSSINSKSSRLNFLATESAEAHAMYDVESQKETPMPGTIKVKSTVVQTERQV